MFICFDTETSGLVDFKLPADHAQQPHMAELAAILFDDDGNEIESWSALIKPTGWVMEAEASKINKITDAMLVNGIPVTEALDRFDAMVARASMQIAFNIRYDDKIIRGARRRHGRPDGFGTVPVFCCMKGSTPICKLPPTPKMVAKGMTQNKTPNLGEAVKIILEREHIGAHRALDDVRATAQIYFKLRGDPVFVAAGQDFKTNAARSPQPTMSAPAMKPPAGAISPVEPETMF